MIHPQQLFRAGTVRKTFGAHGDLIFLFIKEPTFTLDQKEPFFLQIEGNMVPFFMVRAQWHSHTELRIGLEDIDTPEKAAKLLSCHFFLPLTATSKETPILQEINPEGFTITDNTSKKTGVILYVTPYPTQDIMTISFPQGESLVPLIEEYVISVSLEDRTILMELPEGLLDINQ